MSPKIRPIGTKRLTINISCRLGLNPSSTGSRHSARVAHIQTFS